MEESYNKLGGEDNKYYKHIDLNFQELDNLQKYTELELARNTFNPERSQFLSGPLNASSSQSALNGTRILNGSLANLQSKADENLELSREVTRYIAFRKMEKSRSDRMQSMIDTAVTLLNEDDQHNSEIKDVRDILQSEDVHKGNLETVLEVDEEKKPKNTTGKSKVGKVNEAKGEKVTKEAKTKEAKSKETKTKEVKPKTNSSDLKKDNSNKLQASKPVELKSTAKSKDKKSDDKQKEAVAVKKNTAKSTEKKKAPSKK